MEADWRFANWMRWFLLAWMVGVGVVFGQAPAVIRDTAFWQDTSVQYRLRPELTNAVMRKVCLDRDGVVFVLTDRGVARVYDRELALDANFRPLAGRVPRDITVSPSGDLYYLFDDLWLSNGDNGRPAGHFPAGRFDHIAVGVDGVVWLAGPGRLAAYSAAGVREIPVPPTLKEWKLHADTSGFFFWADGQLGAFLPGTGSSWDKPVTSVTALAVRGIEVVVGTPAGYLGYHAMSGQPSSPVMDRIPWTEVTAIHPHPQGLWVGTHRGVFFTEMPAVKVASVAPDAAHPLPGETRFRYYASRRWLPDDDVVGLVVEPQGDVVVLTRTGLAKIVFTRMTLAQKADWFQRKIRSRHIRFGLSAERRLRIPGDIASGEMIDTDNDGGWSSYYLASQALRYAVTREEPARRHAWETLGALERLQHLHTNEGFPARTFERSGGFRVSDPDRWHASTDPGWDWKAHTSSDEIASHMFAYSILWELGARDDGERQRIRRLVERIVNHVLRNNLYLIDVDGKPTLWGRWNPEYVNRFPPTVFDRRLNSAELVAMLQLAHRMTGKAEYRDKIRELFDRHGYLTNIVSGMRLVGPTPGMVHEGQVMGDEWNHSDDELAFITYWVLTRFALDDRLKARYREAVADHWAFEKDERYPFWNFVAAGCGVAEHDAQGAVWTLRAWPLDTVTWRVENSHRRDLTFLPPNFMRRELKELLPPGERQAVRCNTQPFILDGGDGGRTEFAGDEFLLGYWLGRYVGSIGPAE